MTPSLQIPERAMLPAVREAPPDALIVADGFSCREQIAQSTNRRAWHLAEVLADPLHDADRGQAASEGVRTVVG